METNEPDRLRGCRRRVKSKKKGVLFWIAGSSDGGCYIGLDKKGWREKTLVVLKFRGNEAPEVISFFASGREKESRVQHSC